MSCLKLYPDLNFNLQNGYFSKDLIHYTTCSCGLSNATIEYSCPSVCLCVCVCVHDNLKKLEKGFQKKPIVAFTNSTVFILDFNI